MRLMKNLLKPVFQNKVLSIPAHACPWIAALICLLLLFQLSQIQPVASPQNRIIDCKKSELCFIFLPGHTNSSTIAPTQLFNFTEFVNVYCLQPLRSNRPMGWKVGWAGQTDTTLLCKNPSALEVFPSWFFFLFILTELTLCLVNNSRGWVQAPVTASSSLLGTVQVILLMYGC